MLFYHIYLYTNSNILIMLLIANACILLRTHILLCHLNIMFYAPSSVQSVSPFQGQYSYYSYIIITGFVEFMQLHYA